MLVVLAVNEHATFASRQADRSSEDVIKFRFRQITRLLFFGGNVDVTEDLVKDFVTKSGFSDYFPALVFIGDIADERADAVGAVHQFHWELDRLVNMVAPAGFIGDQAAFVKDFEVVLPFHPGEFLFADGEIVLSNHRGFVFHFIKAQERLIDKQVTQFLVLEVY